MVLIFKKFNDKLRSGDLLFFYLIYYPLGRFFIELFFRPDAWTLGALPTASVISLISMFIGVLGLSYNHFLRSEPAPAPVTKKQQKRSKKAHRKNR
ncbi:MAG: hypothetical protein DSY55_02735 [Clostridia bacterium]|nr:MAG: hypothetical protein DSY55_02735 [Clostridia bacterium]